MGDTMLSRVLPRVATCARAAVATSGAASRRTFAAAATAGVATMGVASCASFPAGMPDMPHAGIPGTNNERTFLACKPDAVQRGLVADIIMRFEKRGYKLVGLKMVWPTEKMAAEHYSDLSSKKFFPGLCKFFSSGPIVCMCWEGKDVIKQGRQMLGQTQPLDSMPGSIRGDFSIDLGRNICHGSDGPDSAKDELTMWFKPEELHNWKKLGD